MANTSVIYGSSCQNVTGVGSVAWSNPTNANGNNTNTSLYAQVNLTSLGRISNLLVCTFAFGLTGSDTINGIVASFLRKATQNDTDAPGDYVIQLVKNGVVSGTNKASLLSWPTTFGWSANLGASNDTWGLSLKGSDVIGMAVAAQLNDMSDSAYVMAFQATATYTTASGKKFRRSITCRVGSRGCA